eukprot:4105375-Pyramimonas_sp.AAC.1
MSHHVRKRLNPRWNAHGSAARRKLAPVDVGELQTSGGAEDKAAVAPVVPIEPMARLPTASIAKYF